MTIEEAKRELKNYLADKETYRAGLLENEEILRLRARAEGTTASYEPQYGSGHSQHSKIEECVVKIADNELQKELIREGERLEKVNCAIHRVANPFKQILIELYVNGSTLTDAAIKLDHDYKELSRKHVCAVKRYCEIRNRQ